MIFDPGTLEMLYEELYTGPFTFDEWLDNWGYTSGMTDQQIYAALPSYVKSELGEFGLNASWMHDGF